MAGTVANPTTTPAITLSTSVTGMVKGNGTALSAATQYTDFDQNDKWTLSTSVKSGGEIIIPKAIKRRPDNIATRVQRMRVVRFTSNDLR